MFSRWKSLWAGPLNYTSFSARLILWSFLYVLAGYITWLRNLVYFNLLNTQHLRPQLYDTGIRKFASERQRILLFQDQFTTETYMNSLGAGKRGNFLNWYRSVGSDTNPVSSKPQISFPWCVFYRLANKELQKVSRLLILEQPILKRCYFDNTNK